MQPLSDGISFRFGLQPHILASPTVNTLVSRGQVYNIYYDIYSLGQQTFPSRPFDTWSFLSLVCYTFQVHLMIKSRINCADVPRAWHLRQVHIVHRFLFNLFEFLGHKRLTLLVRFVLCG